MDALQFVHSPIDGHLNSFQVLAFSNKGTMNIHIQVFVWTRISFLLEKTSVNRMAGSYVTFLRTYTMILNSGCTILYFYQQCMREFSFVHILIKSFKIYFVFLILAILIDIR